MSKKILLTGSNGLLGQKLVEIIPQQGRYELIASGRGENRNPIEGRGNYTYLTLDITDRNEVLSIFEKEKPDYIIHTAAMTNVDQCEQDKEGCQKNNVDAVKYLTEAAEKTGTFFLHLSTDFIFDGTEGPYAESAKPNPLSYYGETKLFAEEIVKSCKTRWAIARTVLVYGIAHDMSRSNIILWVKKNLEEGKSIQVVNDQWRTPTLAEDLAAGCFLIIKTESEGIFNISGKDFLSPYQMALMTAEFFKLDKKLIVETDGSKFVQPAKRPPKTGFIIKKAEDLLGYRPHSFQEGIGLLAQQLHQAKKNNPVKN